jgi:hypothetical protein
MKNDLRKMFFIDKKLKQIIKNNNKSLLETNKTSISNGIKSSFDNNINFINFAKKIMKKNLMIKYNITPFKHTLISIQNFIESKYCREIAVFKENLIFNYTQEFLKRMYNKNESLSRLPKFVVYYRNYLLFFCRPIFHELKLDEKFQKYYETKAQIFYQSNYNKENKKDKITNNENPITIFTPKIKQLLSGQNSSSQLTIKKVDSNSVITALSLENSILQLLNENNNKSKEKEKKENNIKIKLEKPRFEKERIKPKLMLKINKDRNSISISNTKSLIEKKDTLPLYNKHSRNLIINNPLYTEENTYSNRKKDNKKVTKHFKIFSSHNPNFMIERQKKYFSIIPPIKLPIKENKKKQRTPSVSIRRNTISSRKNYQPKLFSNLFIPSKTESNNNDINYFKTSSNFNTLKNEHLRTKLNLKNAKILSNNFFNQGKNMYHFKKLIVKYNI